MQRYLWLVALGSLITALPAPAQTVIGLHALRGNPDPARGDDRSDARQQYGATAEQGILAQ